MDWNRKWKKKDKNRTGENGKQRNEDGKGEDEDGEPADG